MCCGGKTWTTNVETVAGLAPMGVDVDLLLDPDPDNGLQLLPDSLWARAADGATVRLAKGEEPSFTGEPRAEGSPGDGGTGAVR